jgi:hypothetical protein
MLDLFPDRPAVGQLLGQTANRSPITGLLHSPNHQKQHRDFSSIRKAIDNSPVRRYCSAKAKS